MLDRLEGLRRRAADTLGRGVGRPEGRVRVLEGRELAHQRIELGVRDLWIAQDVIALLVVADQPSKFVETLGGELVDDNQRPLTDAALAAIRAQVVGASELLVRAQIEPGSPRAHKLFAA